MQGKIDKMKRSLTLGCVILSLLIGSALGGDKNSAAEVNIRGTVYGKAETGRVARKYLGVRIYALKDNYELARFRSDEDGDYRVAFRVDPQKVEAVTFVPELRINRVAPVVTGKKQINIERLLKDADLDLVFPLHRPVELKGRIVQAENGTPMPDTKVRIYLRHERYEHGKAQLDDITSGEGGKFAFSVPDAPGLECRGIPAPRKGLRWDNRYVYRQRYKPISEIKKEGLIIKARARKLSIVIRVKYHGAPEEEPDWIYKRLRLSNGAVSGMGRSGVARFFGVSPGQYKISFMDRGAKPVVITSDTTIELPAHRDGPKEVTLHVRPPERHSLTGKVDWKVRGKVPVKKAETQVRAIRTENSEVITGKTDRGGGFAFPNLQRMFQINKQSTSAD